MMVKEALMMKMCLKLTLYDSHFRWRSSGDGLKGATMMQARDTTREQLHLAHLVSRSPRGSAPSLC